MLLKIYEFLLERKIRKMGSIPSHVMVVSDTGGDDFIAAFKKFVGWCKKFGVREITLCTDHPPELGDMKGVRVRVVVNGERKEYGEGGVMLNVISGFAGRDEIVNAIRELARKVAEGKLSPEDVDEEIIEENLTVRSQPDLIIKAGNEIPEFLIWQTIYSELYFADIDWKYLRFADFLRILREYQRRERRYGR